MRAPYTLKKVVGEIVTAPFDPEIYEQFWEGLKKLAYAILVFICRLAMLTAFPISVPAVFYILQLPENEQVPWWYLLSGSIAAYIIAIAVVLVNYN